MPVPTEAAVPAVPTIPGDEETGNTVTVELASTVTAVVIVETVIDVERIVEKVTVGMATE